MEELYSAFIIIDTGKPVLIPYTSDQMGKYGDDIHEGSVDGHEIIAYMSAGLLSDKLLFDETIKKFNIGR